MAFGCHRDWPMVLKTKSLLIVLFIKHMSLMRIALGEGVIGQMHHSMSKKTFILDSYFLVV